VRETRERDR
jgi:hypothetical protein